MIDRWQIGIYFVAGIFLVILLVTWESAGSDSPSIYFFFSYPSAIISALGVAMTSGSGVDDLLASTIATLGGLALGAGCGCVIGSIPLLAPVTKPLVRTALFSLSALPILALAPMFLIWFGTGISLKVALAGILAGLVFGTQTAQAEDTITPDWRDFVSSNGLSRSQRVRKIVLPMATEWILRAFPAAANAAFLGVFVGEFVASDRGVGYRILRAGAIYQIDVVLAYTLIALLLLGLLQLFVRATRMAVIDVVRHLSLDPVLTRKT